MTAAEVLWLGPAPSKPFLLDALSWFYDLLPWSKKTAYQKLTFKTIKQKSVFGWCQSLISLKLWGFQEERISSASFASKFSFFSCCKTESFQINSWLYFYYLFAGGSWVACKEEYSYCRKPQLSVLLRLNLRKCQL